MSHRYHPTTTPPATTVLINQRGEPIVEEWLGPHSELAEGELQRIVFLLLGHLKLEACRTNATKHGNTEIVLREVEPYIPRSFR